MILRIIYVKQIKQGIDTVTCNFKIEKFIEFIERSFDRSGRGT